MLAGAISLKDGLTGQVQLNLESTTLSHLVHADLHAVHKPGLMHLYHSLIFNSTAES